MVQNVPEQGPEQTQLFQPLYPSPWTAAWWVTQTVTNVPADAVNWLVAQGWQVVSVSYDSTTVPPTPSYSLARESLQNAKILQSLLDSYVSKDNDALAFNAVRYNDVVENWSMMLETSHDQFEAQVDTQNTHVTLFLGNLTTYMDEVDDLIDANLSTLATDAATATTALGEMNTKLDELEDNVDSSTTTIEALLTAQSGYLTTFLTDFASKLTELDTNYTAHLALIETRLTEADTDLDAFQATQAAQLALLASEYSAYANQLEVLLATAAANLSNVAAEVDAILDGLQGEYDILNADVQTFLALGLSALSSFETSYSAAVTALGTDYTTHVSTATAFLTGLGTTELARITEQFAASLATQLQALTDRGLYSSAVAADITERNTRDRDEQIQALNDRLMREKFENQHQQIGRAHV